MFEVILLPGAEASFRRLVRSVQERIGAKIDWLAENAADVVHHPLSSMPDDLKGLCRMRVGDYRVLYWIYQETREIKIYLIEHRSTAYKGVRK